MRGIATALLILAISGTNSLYAQLQGRPFIDSLQKVLSNAKEDTGKVMLLNDLAYEEYRFGLSDDALKHGAQQLALATSLHWQRGIASAHNMIGNCYQAKNQIDKSLEHYHEASKIYEQIGRIEKAEAVTFNVGLLFWNTGDYTHAIDYFFKVLKTCENTDRCDMEVSCYAVIASVYGVTKDYNSALEYHLKGLKIAESCSRIDSVQKSEIYSNLAICYQRKGDCANSLIYCFKTLGLTNKLGLVNASANMNGNISLAYTGIKDYPKAVYFAKRSLTISDSIHNKHYAAWALYELGHAYLSFATDSAFTAETQKPSMGSMFQADKATQIRISLDYLKRGLDSVRGTLNETELTVKIYEDLAKAYRLTGNWEKALLAHDIFIAIKDSTFENETDKQLQAQQMKYDFNKKEAATKALQEKKDIQQRNIRNSTLAGMAGLLIFSLVVIRQRNRVKKEKANVELEKGKSDALLLNILPHEVAEELKAKGTTTARHYDNVTVLFTDFVDFTRAGGQMSPQGLIDELHACFKMFDEITGKYNIEKIKTIGDAYLAVCGLPTADSKHAENVVRAAIEIDAFMAQRLAKMGSERTFEVRIGIHSGSVVAGIVGVKKFAYDIWGDTVNTAARMEQNSEAGKINISQTTYELVKDKFACEYRGEVEAKGKGVMKMYFVSSAAATA